MSIVVMGVEMTIAQECPFDLETWKLGDCWRDIRIRLIDLNRAKKLRKFVHCLIATTLWKTNLTEVQGVRACGKKPRLSVMTVDGASRATTSCRHCSFSRADPVTKFDDQGEGISSWCLAGPLLFCVVCARCPPPVLREAFKLFLGFLHLNLHGPLEGPCSR